jgi:hypothetical protein
MAKEVLDLGFPGKVLGSSRAVAVIAVGSSRAVGHRRLERERDSVERTLEGERPIGAPMLCTKGQKRLFRCHLTISGKNGTIMIFGTKFKRGAK